jgi:hypothetical protein
MSSESYNREIHKGNYPKALRKILGISEDHQYVSGMSEKKAPAKVMLHNPPYVQDIWWRRSEKRKNKSANSSKFVFNDISGFSHGVGYNANVANSYHDKACDRLAARHFSLDPVELLKLAILHNVPKMLHLEMGKSIALEAIAKKLDSIICGDCLGIKH